MHSLKVDNECSILRNFLKTESGWRYRDELSDVEDCGKDDNGGNVLDKNHSCACSGSSDLRERNFIKSNQLLTNLILVLICHSF